MDMPFGLVTPRKLPEDQEVLVVFGLEPTHVHCVFAHAWFHPFISPQFVGENMSDNFHSRSEGNGYKTGTPI